MDSSTYQYIANPQTNSQQLLSLMGRLWLISNFATGPFALVYGVDNITECPTEPNIPIYLIAQGVASIILLSLILAFFISCNDDDKATCWFKLMIFAICFTTLVLVSLHFVGSYWVFRIYGELQKDGTCASNCYMLAFIILVASLVCYGGSLLLSPFVLADKLCGGGVDGRRNVGPEGGVKGVGS